MRRRILSLAVTFDRFFHKVDKTLHKKARSLFKKEYLKKKLAGELEVLPRVFEYSFVIRNFQGTGRVLEVGCTASSNVLPIMLTGSGCDVYGVDLRPFNVRCGNFQFIMCDARFLPFRNVFGYCYSVSTIEHIGLTGESELPIDLEGDIKAIKEMLNVLKPNGSLVITVPFGKSDMLPDSRIYDTEDIKRLFAGLEITEEEYIVESNGVWLKTSHDEAARADHRAGRRAVGMFKLHMQKNINH